MVSNPGLEGVVVAETNISLVDGLNGKLVYRGHWAKDLAIRHTFEEVAHLLWYGFLPNHSKLHELAQSFKKYRFLDADTKQLLHQLPKELDIMSAVRTAISSLGHRYDAWPPTEEDALKLTAMVPTVIAYHYRRQKGWNVIEPHPELDHISNYLYMLNGEVPGEALVKALSAYFILTMEHGMNASTFSARVVLSTQSDMVSAICAAIGAMKGPLHGGAPSEVVNMLNEIGSKERAETWIRNHLENGHRLMGFGHRVYKTRDPRAEALKEVIRKMDAKDPWLDLASYVEDLAIKLLEEYKPGRRLYTNVEFYAAAVMRAISLPMELFTPTFTASRMVGWTAHVIEQGQNNRIFRPQSAYVGLMPDESMG